MDCELTLVAGARPVKLVSESLGLSRSQLTARIKQAPQDQEARRRRMFDDAALLDRTNASMSDLPRYGYRYLESGRFCVGRPNRWSM